MATKADIQTLQEVGTFLKAHRENLDLSQRDVAFALNYRNVNFISMLESGTSPIPVGRLIDFVGAYQLQREHLLILIKKLQPEIWELIMTAYETSDILKENKTRKNIESAIEKAFSKAQKEVA